jgi:hypothetical protein
MSCSIVRPSFLLILPLLALAGCNVEQGLPGEGPFGPPRQSALLAPLAGHWSFDLEKTLAAQKAAGVADEQIEQVRKLYADHPEFGQMHADLDIKGDEAVSSGPLSSEYRFFGMHEHDGKICGKAWHHEDRYDPGDMSKCYVRMELKNGDLHLEQRMKDGLPGVNDPDLHSLPPVESGSSADCDADQPADNDWSQWSTLVFVRKP